MRKHYGQYISFDSALAGSSAGCKADALLIWWRYCHCATRKAKAYLFCLSPVLRLSQTAQPSSSSSVADDIAPVLDTSSEFETSFRPGSICAQVRDNGPGHEQNASQRQPHAPDVERAAFRLPTINDMLNGNPAADGSRAPQDNMQNRVLPSIGVNMPHFHQTAPTARPRPPWASTLSYDASTNLAGSNALNHTLSAPATLAAHANSYFSYPAQNYIEQPFRIPPGNWQAVSSYANPYTRQVRPYCPRKALT